MTTTRTSTTKTTDEWNRKLQSVINAKLDQKRNEIRRQVVDEIAKTTLLESRRLTLRDILSSGLPSEVTDRIQSIPLGELAEHVSSSQKLKDENNRLRERNEELRFQRKVLAYLRTVRNGATSQDLKAVDANGKKMRSALTAMLNAGTITTTGERRNKRFRVN